eukprot:scaffold347_cov380-Prasinococcus_capsulatus_cf.AAC.39
MRRSPCSSSWAASASRVRLQHRAHGRVAHSRRVAPRSHAAVQCAWTTQRPIEPRCSWGYRSEDSGLERSTTASRGGRVERGLLMCGGGVRSGDISRSLLLVCGEEAGRALRHATAAPFESAEECAAPWTSTAR